jgi:SagB-type dehydrogenase family enzyme
VPRPRPYRRSRSLVFYWEDGRLVAHNYRTLTRSAVDPVVVPFLHDFDRMEAPRDVVETLARHELLEPAKAQKAANGPDWRAWGTLAEAFHFGTRDVEWSQDPVRDERRLTRRARFRPMPPSVKSAPPRARVTPLPAVRPAGEFVDTLLHRRTWRDFGRRKVPLDQLATLLRLTWGVQHWGIVRGQGRVALKTSPSGGACHAGEVYLLAVRVDGLAPGLYHYQPHRHRLVRVRSGASAEDISRYLPGQPWFRPASALFLMTAVFARNQWRYATARAYRSVLVDAGHLCQTFCLTASWLKLAPFCTMSLADSAIDGDLGLDGVSEGVVYVAGVGTRPAGGWRAGVPGLRR